MANSPGNVPNAGGFDGTFGVICLNSRPGCSLGTTPRSCTSPGGGSFGVSPGCAASPNGLGLSMGDGSSAKFNDTATTEMAIENAKAMDIRRDLKRV